MFQNLNNAQIVDSSEEELRMAMGPVGDNQTGKAGKGSKQIAKIDKSDKTDKNDKGGKTDKTGSRHQQQNSQSPLVDELEEDDLDIALGSADDDDDADDDNKRKPVKKKAAKAVENEPADEPDEDPDDDPDELEEGSEEDEDPDDDDDKDKDKDEDLTDEEAETRAFLKARATLLIKKGEWLDFQGSEEVEWDEDTFAAIELKQREAQRETMREELLDSFGPYGRDIADYAANGGDPEKLIDLFKEQQRVEVMDLSTEDGQKGIVFKHQTEFLKKSPESANRYIKSLIADKELEAEATESKSLMEKNLAEQKKALEAEQGAVIKAAQKKQDDSIKQFSSQVTTYLNDNKEMTVEEKKEILKVLTKYDKKLPNGTPINEFYGKFAEFKKNLPDYINLVRFVMNPKKFMKTVNQKGKNEATEKAFQMVRTANLTKNKGAGTGKQKQTSQKSTGFKLY